jgi:hypothetical protein
METWENQKNMESCPKYISCSITRCPLDIESDLRVELKGEPKCKMWKYYTGNKPRGSEGHLIPRLKDKIVAIGELRGKII